MNNAAHPPAGTFRRHLGLVWPRVGPLCLLSALGACNAILGIEEAKLICVDLECDSEPGSTAVGYGERETTSGGAATGNGSSSEQPLPVSRGDVLAGVPMDAGALGVSDGSIAPPTPTHSPAPPGENAPSMPPDRDDDDDDDTPGVPATACLANQARCDGALLSICNASQTSFTTQSCASAALCDASRGRCDAPACTANEGRCRGARLERCNADRTALEPAGECGSPQLCNEPAGRCDACIPNQARCVDPSTRAVCDVTGQTETRLGCGALETCDDGLCVVLGLPLL